MSDSDVCESLTGYPSHPDSEDEDTRDRQNFHPVLTLDEPGNICLEDIPLELQNELEAHPGDLLPDAPDGAADNIEIIKLSTLQRCYERRSRHTAIYDIVNPKRLVIDDKYTVPRDRQDSLNSKFVCLRMEDPQIDQTTFVGRYCGLGAIIPSVVSDDAWVFRMSLRNQDAMFSTKHTHLHFDVNCNGAKLGKCNLESVWVFMVPDSYINDTGDPVLPGACSGPPHMSKTHYRKFLLFLAKCFEQIGLHGIYCHDPYAAVVTDAEFEHATNILRVPYHELDISDVRKLDDTMRDYYQPWLAGMPEDFEDDFFLSNQPITVSYRYGQNKDIDAPGCTDGVDAMVRNHDMAYVKYFSFATAVHASFTRSISGKIRYAAPPKDLDSIKSPMYDHWLPDRRRRVTTKIYKTFLHEPTQFTRPRLFRQNGQEVEIVEIKDPEVLPVFWDLKKIKEEFAGNDFYTDREDSGLDGFSYDCSRTTPCYLYPLCFTGNLGNFQAHGPMHRMLGLIDSLNHSFSGPALTSGGMQSYLFLSHDYRYSGFRNQESTKTKLSGFFAGVYRRGAIAEKKYLALKKDLEIDLPHVRFAKTIADIQPKSKCQRVETTWHVALDELNEEDQTTEYVYGIIKETAQMWDHGDLRSTTSDCTQVLEPEAIPGMFLWTGFPITSAIESVVDECKSDIDKTWSTEWPLSADRVELISILERLKHYHESGNVKTLPYAALKADSKGAYGHLMLTGWPFLGDMIFVRNDSDNPNHRLRLVMTKIPWNKKKNTVALSATASVKFHYGVAAEQFYRTWAQNSAKLQRVPIDFEMTMENIPRKMAFLVRELMEEYQKCVVHLVSEHVIKDVKSRLSMGASATANAYSAERRAAIGQWSKSQFPLSYGEGFELLSISLPSSTMDVGKGLPFTDPKHISIDEFCHLLFNMGKPNQPSALSPPLWRPSPLLDNLRVTVQMFICFIGKNIPQNRTMSDIFTVYVKFACNKLKINFGPWSAGGFPGSGYTRGKTVDRKVVPTVWCGFGKPPAPGSEVPLEMMDNDEAVGYKLRLAKHKAINLDTRAEWAASQILIGEFPIHFKRTINPTDFTLNAAGIDASTSSKIREVYEWALMIFDINDPVHHLVLFTAMLFQKARPYLNWPTDAKVGAELFMKKKPSDDLEQDNDFETQRLRLCRYICQLPWLDGRSKGNIIKEGEPFIPVFVTYFLAYYLKDRSPLLKSKTTPPGWANKHRRKFLHPINLIRTRLAVAIPTGAGLFTGPRLNIHWTPLSTKVLKERHNTMKLVMEGSFGPMGMYSLLHQMFGHGIAARICLADDVPHPTTMAEFSSRPQLPDPFSVCMKDFDGSPDANNVFDNVPYTIPSFISPHRPKPAIRANKYRMRISESESSSSISVDERLPRMATIDAARLAGKSVKPMPFPELSPLRDGLPTKRQVASTSPEARTTLQRLKKARASQPQPEMSSSSDELEFNQQPSTFWQVKANRAHSHNNKKSLNGNKTVTCEPSIMMESVTFQKERTDSEPHIHNTLLTGSQLPILANSATLSSANLVIPIGSRHYLQVERPFSRPPLLFGRTYSEHHKLSAGPPELYLQETGLSQQLTKRAWYRAYGMQQSRNTTPSTSPA